MDTRDTHIGTAGFSFPHWQGHFYPRGLKPGQWLRFYSEHFNSIEVNSTFYSPPRSGLFQQWITQVPSNFSFTLKMNRVVTHEKALKNVTQELYSFFREASALGPQLSCILFQLPPFYQADIPVLSRAVEEASRIASQLPYPPRLAWEFRHPSWNNVYVLELLRNFGSAMVIHDTPGGCGWIVGNDAAQERLFLLAHEIRLTFEEWNKLFEGGFCYLRFHGTVDGVERREYEAERLEPWKNLCAAMLAQNIPLYGYFKNDPHAAAIRDALRLRSMLGLSHHPHEIEQPSLSLF